MAKRALIVDDSRSARVILSRMLEGYGLRIDASESAEQALAFLENERPDVIFMDHLMPGMDGFQAVQVIKSNPATAMIPVIMYTSQEGELYASQARALGAVGVLPKTVKQSDVQRVLYQLRLLPDRRDLREPVLEPIEINALPPPANTAPAPRVAAAPPPPIHTPAVNADLEAAIRQAVTPILKEQHAELRRWITTVLDSLGYKEAANPTENRVVQLDAAPAPAPSEDRVTIPRTVAIAVSAAAALSLLGVIVLGVLYAGAVDQQASTAATTASTSAAAPMTTPSELAPETQLTTAVPAAARAPAPLSTQQTIVEPVPYGEVPLAGARVDRLRQLLTSLREQNAVGTVQATAYVGDFCLSGNAIEGYAPASDELPARKCDVIGNPMDDGLRAPQRQSLAFANLVGSMSRETQNQLAVEVTHAGRKPVVEYPENPPPEKMTAGEWNRLAERNSRVEFVFQPAGSTIARNAAE